MIEIHTYTAADDGLSVNSYLLSTGDGAVLIDAQLLVSDARALRARIEALRVPLVAAFVTHAHPDHFNGLPYAVPDDVPVYATAAVAQTIAQIAEPKRDQWQPVYGEQWPDRFRIPELMVDDGTTLSVAGLELKVDAVGPAESHADSVLTVETADGPAVFIGDLAFHGTHAYLADGHTGDWLTALDRLSALGRGATLYPGHGSPGDVALLADQRRYLMMYREVVARLAAGEAALDQARTAELDRTMQRFLPAAPLSWMIGLGADAVAAELAAA